MSNLYNNSIPLAYLPPALKALFSQLCGWCAVLGLAWLGALPAETWALVFAQGFTATVTALILRSAWWWLPIHLVFAPLAFAARSLGIPPEAWLATFAVFSLFYWSTYRTQTPLFLTNQKTAAAVGRLLPLGPAEVLDIGCGLGSLLVALRRQRPDLRLTGIESAPAPFLIARLRTWRYARTTRIVRGDFFRHSWAGHALIYAFLSPAPMQQVWEKARREMTPGTLLVSNSFSIPGVDPEQVIEVDDRRRTRLLIFRIPGSGMRQA